MRRFAIRVEVVIEGNLVSRGHLLGHVEARAEGAAVDRWCEANFDEQLYREHNTGRADPITRVRERWWNYKGSRVYAEVA